MAKLQIRRGTRTALNNIGLEDGEIVFVKDEKRIVIGKDGYKIEIPTIDDIQTLIAQLEDAILNEVPTMDILQEINTALSTLQTVVGFNTSGLATLKASDITPGSVAYAVKAEADRAKLAEGALSDALALKQGALSQEQLYVINNDAFIKSLYLTATEVFKAIQDGQVTRDMITAADTSNQENWNKEDEYWVGNDTDGFIRWVFLWTDENKTDGDWREVGTAGDVNLGDYVTLTYLAQQLLLKQDVLSPEQLAVVNAEAFTTTLLNKLNGIEANATATVIVNDLTTTATGQALSAAQGKALNDLITALTITVNGKASKSLDNLDSTGNVKILPSGGTDGQVLKRNASGAAVWADDEASNISFDFGTFV